MKNIQNVFLKALLLWLTILTVPRSTFAELVCILNNGNGTISVYDAATLTPIAPPFPTIIPFIGQASHGIAINSTGTRVYVSSATFDGFISPGFVAVLDATNNYTPIPGSPFTAGAGDLNTNSIALNPAETLVYVTNNTDNSVSVLDIMNNYAPIPGSPFPTNGLNPSLIVAAGTLVYVVNNASDTVAVLDAANNYAHIAGSPFPTGVAGSNGIAINPAGTRLYLTGYVSNDVAVLDITNNYLPIPGSPFPTGSLGSIQVAINPAGTLVYIVNANLSNNVSVLDATTLAPVPGSLFPTGGTDSGAIAINPAGTRLYIGNFTPFPGSVSVFDATTFAPITAPLTTGIVIPVAFAFSPLSLAPSSPTNLRGSQQHNDFGVTFELFNRLTWDASSSSVAGYFVYRNGAKIATVNASTLQYEDHNRKKGVATPYSVTSFDADGNESDPIEVTVY